MKTKTILAAALALGTAFSLSATSFAAEFTPATISLNKHVVEHPDRFVHNGTTYMPIWYVQQTLDRLGIANHWDGDTHAWTLTVKHAENLEISAKGGVTSIEVNGHVVERHVPTLVRKDPKSGVETTFMPIWYVQQLLNRVGIRSDVWNGNTGLWALGTKASENTLPITAPVKTSLSQILSQVIAMNRVVTEISNAQPSSSDPQSVLTAYNNRAEAAARKWNALVAELNAPRAPWINPYSDDPNMATIDQYGAGVTPAPAGVPVSTWVKEANTAAAQFTNIHFPIQPANLQTATQWYNDPKDMFFNKYWDVSKLHNGEVLERYPYYIMVRIGSHLNICQYVGYGPPTEGGVPETWWEEEEVSRQTYTEHGVHVQKGEVTQVIPGLIGESATPAPQSGLVMPWQIGREWAIPIDTRDLASGSEPNGGSWGIPSMVANDPASVSVIGYVIPIPGWNPTQTDPDLLKVEKWS